MGYTMSKKLFGTDGIRGVANEYPMTADMALKIGRAAGHIFRRDVYSPAANLPWQLRCYGKSLPSASQETRHND